MKRFLMLLFAFILVFSLAACDKKEDVDDSDKNDDSSNNDNTDNNGDNGNTDNGGASDSDNQSLTYTVKVQNGEVGVQGVLVMVMGGSAPKPLTTDANGVATFEGEAGKTYTAMIAKADGYEFSTSDVKQFDSSKTAIFSITSSDANEDLVTYTIKVVDRSGNPVAGATVQICEEGGMCLSQKTTDENGIATYEIEENPLWKAKINTSDDYVPFDANRVAEITVD